MVSFNTHLNIRRIVNNSFMYGQQILEISVPSATRRGGHTEYLVHLITNNPSFARNHIAVYKRYSQFRALHGKLKLHIPALPEFPPKSFFARCSGNTVETRRETLQRYMRYVCAFVTRNSFENEDFGRALVEFLVL